MILLACEIALIQIGIIFEVVAYFRSREEAPLEHLPGPRAEVGHAAVDMSRVKVPVKNVGPIGNLRITSPPQKKPVDYYKVEDVPEDVRPADLLRTAKVFYIKKLGE